MIFMCIFYLRLFFIDYVVMFFNDYYKSMENYNYTIISDIFYHRICIYYKIIKEYNSITLAIQA